MAGCFKEQPFLMPYLCIVPAALPPARSTDKASGRVVSIVTYPNEPPDLRALWCFQSTKKSMDFLECLAVFQTFPR